VSVGVARRNVHSASYEVRSASWSAGPDAEPGRRNTAPDMAPAAHSATGPRPTPPTRTSGARGWA